MRQCGPGTRKWHKLITDCVSPQKNHDTCEDYWIGHTFERGVHMHSWGFDKGESKGVGPCFYDVLVVINGITTIL